jgi:hypothetical protein
MKNDNEIRQICDQALADYDFGEGVTVEATSGWEYSSNSSEITCPVFLRFDEDAEDEDTHLANFSVVVSNNKVVEAYCTWKGETIGIPFSITV